MEIALGLLAGLLVCVLFFIPKNETKEIDRSQLNYLNGVTNKIETQLPELSEEQINHINGLIPQVQPVKQKVISQVDMEHQERARLAYEIQRNGILDSQGYLINPNNYTIEQLRRIVLTRSTRR